MKKQRGITLIALVITIIVLLLLAGVSINVIMGEDGIIARAQQSSEQTKIAAEKEQLALAFSEYKLNNATNNSLEEVTASQLQDQLNKVYGSGNVTVTGEGMLTVKFNETDRMYLVLQSGATIELKEVLKNATYGVAVGLAEDGSLVDMANWNYTLINLDEDYTNGEISGYELGIEDCGWTNGYKGEIVEGKIEGKVPAYILENPSEYGNGTEEGTFLPVISMAGTFKGNVDLMYAPEIPSTVIRLGSSYFSGCFYDCESLITAPIISKNVREMWSTFTGCISLEKAPDMHKDVYNTASCFERCSSLTGTLKIDANPENYSTMFDGAATNDNCDLVLIGKSAVLSEMVSTGTEGSNIRVGK